jgi:hypothetical protein
LANNTIQDKLTRIILISGACAGLCYSALWYFPVLIGAGGVLALAWDIWLSRWVGKGRARWHLRKGKSDNVPSAEETQDVILSQQAYDNYALARRRRNSVPSNHPQDRSNRAESLESHSGPSEPLTSAFYAIPIWMGVVVIVGFFGKQIATQFEHNGH